MIRGKRVDMKDELSKQQTDDVLKALNDAIDQGPWDESNFLRMLGKNLQDIRDEFSKQVDSSLDSSSQEPSGFEKKSALRSGQQEVFVALYSSDGSNIQAWERILVNLPNQMISRPIYADEEDIQAIIKLKENKINEAYVSIYINQSDVLPLGADKIIYDKRGKPLLALKAKSLRLENMNRFVNFSGIYRLYRGRLIQMSRPE